MRANQVHVFNRFVFALSLFVCLVVAACAEAGVSPTQATPTVRVPAFAAKLQPLLEAKMQQLHIPGAIIFVDLPGQGSWTTALGLIIEQITHRLVEEVFQQRIFTPLGMNSSSLPPRTSAAIPDPHPLGYMFGTLVDLVEGPKANAAAGTPQDVTSWSLLQAWTAGAAISTLHDLKIWAKVLATGKLLSAVAHQEQLSFMPESHPASDLLAESAYSLLVGLHRDHLFHHLCHFVKWDTTPLPALTLFPTSCSDSAPLHFL